MSKTRTIGVTERALLQRIRRKLVHKGESLIVSRSENERANVGDYYIVNDRNVVAAAHCDLEKLGRDTGALRPWETLAE
jgi:hypothetical protein